MKLGFAILAHDHPQNVARLARRLLACDCVVSIHYDARGSDGDIAAIRESLGDLKERVVFAERVSVGWGEWSMIEATLNAVRAIFEIGFEPEYVHLMSAADYPIRPVKEFEAFLERHRGTDFIESYSVKEKKWVLGGLWHERYQYRHYFSFKGHPRLFDLNWKLQRLLRIKRRIPAGLTIHMGSQWCTLTSESWKFVIENAKRSEIKRFFKTSWIPDEMAIQTLLAEFKQRHSNRHLTLYQFSDYGVPVVYCNGHFAHLAKQPFFFARKISPHADQLRDELDGILSGESAALPMPDGTVGTPTSDYESFRLASRTPMPGRRIPGQIKDVQLGDLEWNRASYVAIQGASGEELDLIADFVNTLPGFVGHGALFSRNTINFAGKTERLAGYGRQDTALRDHSRSNFLADVIGQNPGKTTSFTLGWREKGNFDFLCLDKNCRTVLAKGNMLRAFGEARAAYHKGGDGPTLYEFKIFSDEYSGYFATQRERLRIAKAKFTEIDLCDPNWRGELVKYLEFRSDRVRSSSLAEGAVLAGDGRKLRDVSETLKNAWELLAGIPDVELRNRHAAEILSRRNAPYLVLIGASRGELADIAARLSGTGIFSTVASSASECWDYFSSLARQEWQAAETKIGIHLCGTQDFSRLGFIAGDPNARMLLVRGNLLLAAREFHEQHHSAANAEKAAVSIQQSQPWCEPSLFNTFYKLVKEGENAVFGEPATEAATRASVNLLEEDWANDITAFLSGSFQRLLNRGNELRLALGSGIRGAKHKFAADSGTIYSNAGFLCTLIEDEGRRQDHLKLVEDAQLRHSTQALRDA